MIIKHEEPKVSVIILNWNGLEDTIDCLASLKKITYSNYEVILVDNASSGDDVEVLREKYGDYIHIIANDKNYGFSEGNNIGMRHALDKQSNYMFLLNNDTVLDPSALTELVKVSESDSTIGITGGKVYFYDKPDVLQTVGGEINWWLGKLKHYNNREDIGQFEEIADRDFIYATAMLIKREVVEKISLLDSKFFFGIEEYDYCTRAKRAGFRVVYVPSSKVWHKAGASRKKLPLYPETERKIKRETGPRSYKHFFRLFYKNGPPVIFIFAYVKYMVTSWYYYGLARGAIYYILHGRITPIKEFMVGSFKR
jgi:GT2 family glycosyltransferase